MKCVTARKRLSTPKLANSNLLKNLVFNFYVLFYNENWYYFLCSCTQIRYLEKILYLRYGPKSSQPIRLQDFQNNYTSRTNRWSSLIFFHADTNSVKLKVGQKCFLMGMVKDVCGQSCHGTLTLIASHEWTNEINWFFAWWYKFRKAKGYFNYFWEGKFKNGDAFLFNRSSNLLYLRNEFMNGAGFLHADSDAIISG